MTLPVAIPIRYVVTPKIPVVSEMPNVLCKPGIDDVYEVEYSTTQLVPYDIARMTRLLYQTGHSFGFPSSPSSQSTSNAGSDVCTVVKVPPVFVRWMPLVISA